MKKFLIAFLLSLNLYLPAFAQDKRESAYDRVMRTQTLRCGYFEWPPYMHKDESTGKFNGVYYDIVEALGKTLGLKIEWSYEYALGQQVEALKSGKMDALCADGPWTRSAMPFLDYSHPYMFIPGYIYVQPKNPRALSLEKLNAPDVRFTAMDGDGSADYLEMLVPKAKILSLPSTADPSLLIENIITGKADAMFSDPMTVEAQGAHNKDMPMMLNPGNPVATYPFVISLPKGEQSLLNMLDQGLDVLNDTGMIEKILKTYDPARKKILQPQKLYITGEPK